MTPTATHINYLHICHRKLWLFHHGVQMEHTSQLVAEGKMIHEHSYPQRARKWQEVQIGSVKIDHFDAQRGVIREIKKSAKMEQAHIAQVKYYIWTLEQYKIAVSHAILEYPKLRQTEKVELKDTDRNDIMRWIDEVQYITQGDCPEPITAKRVCKKCSYFDFCYVETLE